jgi:hypothetical protein
MRFLFAVKAHTINHEGDAEDNHHICEVENRPNVKIKIIYDASDTDAIDKIAHRPRDHEMCPIKKTARLFLQMAAKEQKEDKDESASKDKKHLRTFKHAKSRSRIQNERDVKERSKDRDAFARCHMMHNEKLDQLVKGYDATKKYR